MRCRSFAGGCLLLALGQAAAQPPQDPEPVDPRWEAIDRHCLDRDVDRQLAVLTEIRITQPKHPRALFLLGELYASESKYKDKEKARQAFTQFLDLPLDAMFKKCFPETTAVRDKARGYLDYLKGARKVYTLSPWDRLKADLAALQRSTATVNERADKSKQRIPELQKQLEFWTRSRAPNRGHSILQLKEDIKKHERILAACEQELAHLTEDIATIQNHLARKPVEIAPVRAVERVSAAEGTPVEQALQWLVQQQGESGEWGEDKGATAIGLTGLSVLALIAHGAKMHSGPHWKSVQRGVEWLKSQQAETGLIGTQSGRQFHYGHAIATLALIEAARVTEFEPLRPNLERAVRYIEDARNPGAGWRYFPRDGDNDTSVTGWMVLALNAARNFGLTVRDESLREPLAWLHQATDANGITGYTKVGEGSSREVGVEERFPATKTRAMTASALLARLMLGEAASVQRKSLESILAVPPVWNEQDGSIDFYYWFFATHSLARVGGADWTTWRRAIGAVLRKGQLADGSFKACDPWSGDGGPVYSTVLCALCLMTAEAENKLFFAAAKAK